MSIPRTVIALGLISITSLGVAQQPAKDYKDIDLTKFDILPVEVKKDPKTGFVVGGKNSTQLLRKLTHINGISIAKLEQSMRPKELSQAGFLGKDEKLLDVLAADNEYVVDQLGLTHQELARHLHAMGVISRLLGDKAKPAPLEFVYQGRRFRVKREDTRGMQPSPFLDGTRSGSNVEVVNLDNGKKMWYGLLVPFMVERYGFYEGKGTRYRLEPRDVIAVFDFLQPAKK